MLTSTDRAVLESAHLQGPARGQASLDLGLGLLGLSARLMRLLDDPDAEREYPAIVHRERRLRDVRRVARARRWDCGGH